MLAEHDESKADGDEELRVLEQRALLVAGNTIAEFLNRRERVLVRATAAVWVG